MTTVPRTGHDHRAEQRVAAVMGLEAASLAVMSARHLSGTLFALLRTPTRSHS